jgi:predicted DNA-binding transcriptional regulator AlpA
MDIQNSQTIHLRTRQAAEYLGLSPSTMEKMRLHGNGPTYAKLGRVVIYNTNDLAVWVEARKRISTLDMIEAPTRSSTPQYADSSTPQHLPKRPRAPNAHKRGGTNEKKMH